LEDYILKYNYHAKKVEAFDQIMETFHAYKSHLVLLDITLPYYDGFYCCRPIRKISICTVLFFSARTATMAHVIAIDNGGDDYIVKPFSPDVVMAKIRSLLRRAYGDYAGTKTERIVELNHLKLYPERHELKFDKNSVLLTKNETYIVELLMERYP